VIGNGPPRNTVYGDFTFVYKQFLRLSAARGFRYLEISDLIFQILTIQFSLKSPILNLKFIDAPSDARLSAL
jgi:hypothetical protein